MWCGFICLLCTYARGGWNIVAFPKQLEAPHDLLVADFPFPVIQEKVIENQILEAADGFNVETARALRPQHVQLLGQFVKELERLVHFRLGELGVEHQRFAGRALIFIFAPQYQMKLAPCSNHAFQEG